MNGERFSMRQERARAVRYSWALRGPVAHPTPGWEEGARCRGARRIFFSSSNTHITAARKLCEGCPVRLDCIASCFQREDGRYCFGVYGGLVPAERLKARREDARSGRPS